MRLEIDSGIVPAPPSDEEPSDMTLMLASVTDAGEAEVAARLGADIVDLKDPQRGALGAMSLEVAQAAVAAVADSCETSATAGDPPYDPGPLAERAEALIESGVDYLKLAVDAQALAALSSALLRFVGRTKLVGLMFADRSPDFALLADLAKLGFKGAMLDTSNKTRGGLLSHLDINRAAEFVDRCRQLSLFAGLAGSLEAPDVPRLCLIKPDVLGFRGALCCDQDRRKALDPQSVALIRRLIPRSRVPDDASHKIDWRLLARGLVGGREREADVDTVYVRGFQISADVGAYGYERGRPQRLSFDVEAAVSRSKLGADEMTEVFSYDVILDAIRLVLGRGRANFLETVAENVAQMVLADSRVRSVCVNVRKLDIVEGSVGVKIRRARESVATSARFGGFAVPSE
jgi:dihydroneopterin aldolase